MRSRYSAFALRNVGWLKESLWPKYQKTLDMAELTEFAQTRQWIGLEILQVEKGSVDDKTGMVKFVAKALENGEVREHREASLFRKKKGTLVLRGGRGRRAGEGVAEAMIRRCRP